MVMPHLRSLYNVANRQQTQIHGLQRKLFPLKNDYFDTVTPLEAVAEKEILQTCSIREAKTTIAEVERLLKDLNDTGDGPKRAAITQSLRDELRKIPNRTHPTVLSYGNADDPVEIATYGEITDTLEIDKTTTAQTKTKKKSKGQLVDSTTFATGLHLMRMERLSQFCGSRSYYLLHDLAQMVNIPSH